MTFRDELKRIITEEVDLAITSFSEDDIEKFTAAVMSHIEDNVVEPTWMFDLTFQMQSVLRLGARGPDGIRKHHPMKDIQRVYRAVVTKAAAFGRELSLGEAGDNFMSLDVFYATSSGNGDSRAAWRDIIKTYFRHVDELPHHFHLHLVHGAQIIGEYHPNEVIRWAFSYFYLQACDDAHMSPESKGELEARLNDWGKKYWHDGTIYFSRVDLEK